MCSIHDLCEPRCRAASTRSGRVLPRSARDSFDALVDVLASALVDALASALVDVLAGAPKALVNALASTLVDALTKGPLHWRIASRERLMESQILFPMRAACDRLISISQIQFLSIFCRIKHY